MRNFKPIIRGTAKISATGTSSATALATEGGDQVEFYNAGPDDCFFALGASGVTAVAPGAAGDYPVGPGQSKVVDRGGATHFAAVCDSGKTASAYATCGNGS